MSRKPAMDPKQQRQVVRDAMDRLLKGNPVRSDGKLTVKSLAEEAGVKRWVLTHQHADLQDEFRSRMEMQGQEPEKTRAAVSENAKLKERVRELSAKIKTMNEEQHRLVRIIQVLTLENQQMCDAGIASKVRRLDLADEPPV